MKRIAPPSIPSAAEPNGPRYWRSLDDLSGHPAFQDWLHREFQDGASELTGVNRRQFVKMMAASFALGGAAFAGCRRPESYIRPSSNESSRHIPGLPLYYASSLPDAYDNLPLVVETHSARPTKIEGNEQFTDYGGATDLFAQASVLDLYDPDRATRSSSGRKPIAPTEVFDLIKTIHDKYLATGGQGLAVLAEPSTSPTRLWLREEIGKKFPQLIWTEYTPISQEHPAQALSALFGRPVRSIPHFAKASRILSLDADFLAREPGKLGHAQGFAANRRVRQVEEAAQMSRLYVAESHYTLTGAMADHRLRLASTHIPALAARFLAEALQQLGLDVDFGKQLKLRSEDLSVDPQWISACLADLLSAKGHALVVAGSHQPPAVHAMVAFLNELLEAVGQTVTYHAIPSPNARDLSLLADNIRGGKVETLFILGGNPVYNAPADQRWNVLQKKVPQVIRHGYYYDETALEATDFIAATHYLESWSDGRTFDGTMVPVQPVILPLFEGVSELEVLARLGGLSVTDPFTLVQNTFQRLSGGKEHDFQRFLRDGVLPGSGFPQITARFPRSEAKSFIDSKLRDYHPPKLSAQALEIRTVSDAKMFDGRYNNNGWLQECPDPMTKTTWDNAIQISPALAEHLGFTTKDGTFLLGGVSKKSAVFSSGRELAPLGTLTCGDVTITGPVQVLPGLADWTVVLPLGYGRTKTGRVGKGTGFNAYPAFTSQSAPALTGGTLQLSQQQYRLATTQEHWSIEGRDTIREANAPYFLKHPEFAQKMGIESHSPPIYGKDQDRTLQEKVTQQFRGASSYEHPRFDGGRANVQQWGMSIDLNTCIGCNACVIACQSENNIPIVGKDQVLRGREMHWIRIDRYFASGSLRDNQTAIPRDPQVSLMPMPCQHCENAPCEQVCPVNATVHDDQGLNVMAYNRCVGTRYCANNCPYKVRRFNFFDWNKREIGRFYEGPLGPNRYAQGATSELQKMRANPEVTVRMRGVMEKCTFCQQRIQNAKIAQKTKTGLVEGGSDHVKVPDGLIKTACQQVCPTGAIVFGDVSDEHSAVSQTKHNHRDYSVLGYLNVRPRVTYLARLRNPNPQMPDYAEMPLFQREYQEKSGHGTHGGEGHGMGPLHKDHSVKEDSHHG